MEYLGLYVLIVVGGGGEGEAVISGQITLWYIRSLPLS